MGIVPVGSNDDVVVMIPIMASLIEWLANISITVISDRIKRTLIVCDNMIDNGRVPVDIGSQYDMRQRRPFRVSIWANRHVG